MHRQCALNVYQRRDAAILSCCAGVITAFLSLAPSLLSRACRYLPRTIAYSDVAAAYKHFRAGAEGANSFCAHSLWKTSTALHCTCRSENRRAYKT